MQLPRTGLGSGAPNDACRRLRSRRCNYDAAVNPFPTGVDPNEHGAHPSPVNTVRTDKSLKWHETISYRCQPDASRRISAMTRDAAAAPTKGAATLRPAKPDNATSIAGSLQECSVGGLRDFDFAMVRGVQVSAAGLAQGTYEGRRQGNPGPFAEPSLDHAIEADLIDGLSRKSVVDPDQARGEAPGRRRGSRP